MNKFKGFIIMLLMATIVVVMPVKVMANTNNVSQKYLDFNLYVPESFKSNEVSLNFKIKNKDTNKEYYVNVEYNSLQCRFVADYGSYELIEGSVRISSYKSILALEQYEVSMQPFVVNDSMDGYVDVKIISKGGSMIDSGSNTSQSTSAAGNNNESDGNTLTLPADNKYFPNMTLTEIKKWYLDECAKHIASGKEKNYKIDDFKKAVQRWSKDSFDKYEDGMRIEYIMVSMYNTPDTQEFYLVQKKLYDFIKDYHDNNEYMLNFSNWDKVNQLPTEAPTEAPSSNEESTQTPTQQVTEPTVESTEASTSADIEDGKTFPIIIIIAVPIMLLLIITAVVIFLWKRRTTNK